jgi:hypothetical protein
MIDVISAFNGIRSCIKSILCELDSLQKILKMTNEQFPIYEGTIYSLENSINNLDEIYKYGIPIEHELEFRQLKILDLKLTKFNEILIMLREWDKNILKPKCLSFDQCVYFFSNPSPSKILEKLETTFKAIEPLVLTQIELEKNILGTAIRIPHPILQKTWLMMGRNQLNESDIPSNIIEQNLYNMLKKEENNHIAKEQYYCNRIKKLVKYIDGLAMTKPDKKITIIEICQFLPTEENSKTVKDLLSIKEIDDIKIDEEENEIGVLCKLHPSAPLPGFVEIPKDRRDEGIQESAENIEIKDSEEISLIVKSEKVIKEKEPIYLSIPILFEKPVKVNYLGTRTIKEPYCSGYGADFNNINACTFIIPNDLNLTFDEAYKLCGIDIECNVTDQNFGGTNQSNVRYQINDNFLVKVIQVDRNQVPSNNYKFFIPPNEIKLGDTVKIWIFSPGWNGWSITLNSISAKARFIITYF